MTSKNKINDAMAELGAFAQRHPEILPERLAYSTQCLVRFLTSKKLDINAENLEWGWKILVESIETLHLLDPEPAEELDTPEQTAEIDALIKKIDSFSADEMRDYMKSDPAIAAAIENVLTEKARLEKLKAKKAKKVQPAPPKPKPPVRSAEEAAIDRMSAEEFKRALSKSPEIARGIENTLAAAARRKQ